MIKIYHLILVKQPVMGFYAYAAGILNYGPEIF